MAATIKCDTIVNASSATNNLTLNTDGSVTTGNAVIMGSGSFLRNRIINGGMQIWQRGTSFPNPAVSGNFYTADRWAVNRAGDIAGATVSRSTSVPAGFQYSLVLQRTAANTSTAGIYLFNSNETVNVLDLAGQYVTLSFYAKVGANYSGGALTTTIVSGTGTDERVYAYTGSSTVASLTSTLTTTWTRYSVSGLVASNATELGFQSFWTPTGTAGADDAVYITGVQLEAGSVATPFERVIFPQQVLACERYYQKTYDLGTAPGSNTRLGLQGGLAGASGLPPIIFLFRTDMRVAPTISYWDGAGNANKYTTLSSGTFTDNLSTAPLASVNIATTSMLWAAPSTSGSSYQLIQYTANSEL